MDHLLLLADIAAMQNPIPSLKERRLVFLERARLRMKQLRAKKASYVKPKPKPKKVVNPDWRHENLKKAHIVLAKKREYKKMIAQDTEPEE
jgi:hypothetical protein